jgi:hypothetical protein
MLLAHETAVAIDNHGGREHQPVYADPRHCGQHHRCRVVVVGGEPRKVLSIDPVADQRRLMTDDVNAVEQPLQRGAVAYIENMGPGRRSRTRGMCLSDHRVDAGDLVPATGELMRYLGADEPR